MIFYNIVVFLIKWPVRWLYRIKIEGIENLPKDGGFIICANHTSGWDPVILACCIKKHICYMGKEEVFKIPVLGWLLRCVGAFPVSRGNSDMWAVKTAIDIVDKRKVLGIFPEGTRSTDGKLLKVKAGAILIAAKSGGDIVPVGINATIKPKMFKRTTVRIGTVLKNEELLPNESKRGLILGRDILTKSMKSLLDSEVE